MSKKNLPNTQPVKLPPNQVPKPSQPTHIPLRAMPKKDKPLPPTKPNEK